jgi:phenylacetate-coenzyme A ligase PaaK-like adenylate-forming protein
VTAPVWRAAIRLYEGGLKRRPIFRYWEELERSQWLPAAGVAAIQLDALRNLLQHARATCPYYTAEWARRGLDPDGLGSLDDFRRWPVVDRETINAHRDAMRTTRGDIPVSPKATGGSSGTPLRFFLDAGSYDRRNAAWHRGYGWAGAAPGTRQFYLWGVPIDTGSTRTRWKLRLYDALYRRTVASCFGLSEATAPEFLKRLNHTRPDVIVAYTNPLYAFARMLRDRGLTPYSPRSIVVGAEKLHDFQRKEIEAVFGAPVFETYGSREFMLIGAECDRHAGLHLTSEQLVVEVLDDAGAPAPPGVEGDVVITDLYNYGMPFVRYANGDRALAGAALCDCGRGLPLLRKVVGRRLDILTTPDGRRIPGEFFPHLVKEFPAVRRFQVVQDRPERITMKVVLGGPPGDAGLDRLTGEVRKVVGPSVGFSVEPVGDIPLTAAGKLLVVVNQCASS